MRTLTLGDLKEEFVNKDSSLYKLKLHPEVNNNFFNKSRTKVDYIKTLEEGVDFQLVDYQAANFTAIGALGYRSCFYWVAFDTYTLIFKISDANPAPGVSFSKRKAYKLRKNKVINQVVTPAHVVRDIMPPVFVGADIASPTVAVVEAVTSSPFDNSIKVDKRRKFLKQIWSAEAKTEGKGLEYIGSSVMLTAASSQITDMAGTVLESINHTKAHIVENQREIYQAILKRNAELGNPFFTDNIHHADFFEFMTRRYINKVDKDLIILDADFCGGFNTVQNKMLSLFDQLYCLVHPRLPLAMRFVFISGDFRGEINKSYEQWSEIITTNLKRDLAPRHNVVVEKASGEYKTESNRFKMGQLVVVSYPDESWL